MRIARFSWSLAAMLACASAVWTCTAAGADKPDDAAAREPASLKIITLNIQMLPKFNDEGKQSKKQALSAPWNKEFLNQQDKEKVVFHEVIYNKMTIHYKERHKAKYP
jgi:hypothetical protein